MNQDERTYRLEHQPISQLLLHYTIPAIVATMVNALYNVVDRIFIGQGAGTYAIAGLALTFPILIFLQAFGMLIGVGASARISILLGQHNRDGAERILGTAMVLTLITQVLIIIPVMLYMEPLLRFFGGSERTIPYAVDYLRIVVPANLLSTIAMGYSSIIRASGYPQKAMYAMLIGAVVNTCLDALFIFGFGWGIAGAAWATDIAMLASAVFVMRHFYSPDSLIRFKREYFRADFEVMRLIASIGLSPFAVQLLGSVVSILFNKAFHDVAPTPEMADTYIGSYGVLNSFMMLGVMLMLGISQGMQPIVGYNYGAKLYGRVRRTFVICAALSMSIGAMFTLISQLFPEFVCTMFTKDPTLIEVSTASLRIIALGFWAVGFQIIAVQCLQSVGLARQAFLLSISRQTLFFIPLLLILPNHFGLNGVWYSGITADVMSALLGFLMVNWQFRRISSSSNAVA